MTVLQIIAGLVVAILVGVTVARLLRRGGYHGPGVVQAVFILGVMGYVVGAWLVPRGKPSIEGIQVVPAEIIEGDEFELQATGVQVPMSTVVGKNGPRGIEVVIVGEDGREMGPFLIHTPDWRWRWPRDRVNEWDQWQFKPGRYSVIAQPHFGTYRGERVSATLVVKQRQLQ
jgi:hypothetical protein